MRCWRRGKSSPFSTAKYEDPLNHDRLVEAIRTSGAKATVTKDEGSIGGRTYHGEFRFKGVKVYGVLYEDELEAIGYHLVDGKPVPMNQSAPAV